VEFLKSKGIVPEAYSPFGSTGSPLFSDDVAVEIASKHSVKTADVLLAWLCMSSSHSEPENQRSCAFGPVDKKGCVVIPKSVTPSRIDANLSGFIDALGKLDDTDVEKLDGVAASGKQKRFIMPAWGDSSFLLSFVNLPYTNNLHCRIARPIGFR